MSPLTTEASVTINLGRLLKLSAYQRQYVKAVTEECVLIASIIKPGKSISRVITPKGATVNVPNPSIIKEDFSGPGCMKYNLLRDLYRDKCQKGINLSVTARVVMAKVDGQEVSVTMMVVSFMIPKRHAS